MNLAGISNGTVHGPVLCAPGRLYAGHMVRNAVSSVQFQDRTQGREILARAERLYISAGNSASACSYPDHRFIFPATLQLARGPAFVGPFFMPQQWLTAYTVGRFSFSIPAPSAPTRPAFVLALWRPSILGNAHAGHIRARS